MSKIIKELPKEIQDIVFQRQAQAGNRPDDSLTLQASSSSGNFAWANTDEGMNWWEQVDKEANKGDYTTFYTKYPKEGYVTSSPVQIIESYPLY